MSDLKSKVDFSLIRYANCWEDPLILSEGLAVRPGDKVLSIASAGDNSFFLLMNEPELVVAADLNDTQLYLVELKAAAIRAMEREEYLAFAGFHNRKDRRKIFASLRAELTSEARAYWDERQDAIEAGIIYDGKFERYFQFFAWKILPRIHSRKRIDGLFTEKFAQEQVRYYEKVWNNRRWRMLFKIFFSRYVMGKFGRDPQFLKEVNMNVSEFIFSKAAEHLASKEAQHNFILHFTLSGKYGEEIPPYVEAGNYERIRKNLKQLRLYSGYIQNASTTYGEFHKMNLSDIFEYLDKPTFEALGGKITSTLSPGGRMAYWNLMVPRRISSFDRSVNHLADLSESLSKQDKGFFYNKFIVEERTL
jgi:S-adenosylmethionine-diacylglycerol 3-amino-3-carboxypropyl transferase